ncbi:Probable ATP-dependent RNA helicase pitchoune [Gryllus bimaculatus]|nr:Probable ATP-dependent RNA helicase pitchoune [Gryllus bimaculatus]
MKERTNRGGKGGKFGVKKTYDDRRKFKKESEENEMKRIRNALENIDSENVNQFKDLPLSRNTLYGLRDSEYVKPTEVQRESLCLSLRGLDVLGAAKTGSGKTLAFIIPILETLYLKKWVRADGVGALVITPTRELAYQIFETLRKVGRHHDFSAGLIIGGKDLHFEKHRMDSCNIIICTPGRLLQHMDENPLFSCDNLQILVLDEADRCLDMGFEQTMNSIIENLPLNRQTLLFSATQTKSVRDLARLSLKDPMYVSVHEHAKHSTPEGLQQSYVVCELHEKMDMLWSFIKNHRKHKILVFLSSCKQVKYHYEMFCRLRPGISLLALYGTLHQMRRMAIYEDFCKKTHAVLFATDIAARGLDFPEVNWVLQLDCPEDANTYIHRAGRTARYHRGGESLLVLLPSEEEGMIEQLKAKKIPITKIRINPKKLQSPLKKVEASLAENPELKATAQRAFISYLKSIYLMKNKSVFNVHALDTNAYSRSLGLAVPPKIRFLKKAQKLLQQKESQIEVTADVILNSYAKNAEGIEKLNSFSESSVNEVTASSHGAFSRGDSESESEDDFLQIKRKDHELDDILTANSIDEREAVSQKNRKIKTKALMAKKILKKKIVANKKIVFDDEGKALVNQMREKVSEVAKEYETENVGGIDIEKAKLILKEEDKHDKKLFREKIKAKHREEKLKLQKKKGKHKNDDEEERDEESTEERDQENAEEEDEESGEDSDSGPDLSWLPDPDKVYGSKQNSDAGNDNDNDSDVGSNRNDDSDHENIDDKTSDKILKNNLSEEEYEDTSERLMPRSKRKSEYKISKSSKRRNIEESSEQMLLADEELALHFLKTK